MTDSLNDKAAKIVKDWKLLGQCLCVEFAHLIIEQDAEIEKLKAEIKAINKKFKERRASHESNEDPRRRALYRFYQPG